MSSLYTPISHSLLISIITNRLRLRLVLCLNIYTHMIPYFLADRVSCFVLILKQQKTTKLTTEYIYVQNINKKPAWALRIKINNKHTTNNGIFSSSNTSLGWQLARCVDITGFHKRPPPLYPFYCDRAPPIARMIL